MFAGELHHIPHHVAVPLADPIVGGVGFRARLQADGWGEVKGSATHITAHTHTVTAHTLPANYPVWGGRESRAEEQQTGRSLRILN